MKDLYFIRINGKSQLISVGVKAEIIHSRFFKKGLYEAADYMSKGKLSLEENERQGRQLIWAMMKAADKKIPNFEKWNSEIGKIETAAIISEIAKKITKRGGVNGKKK